MKRSIVRWAAYLQLGLILFTGCHPTQPFFIAEDGDLSHYLDTATQIEYADLKVDSIPEVTEAYAPFTLGNEEFEFAELSLEDCVALALNNSKLVRSLPGSNLQTGDIATAILSSPSSQLRTQWDPAITASTANSQPRVIDQNGNRTLPRGASLANQVGGVEDALAEFDAQYSSILAYNTTDRQRNTGTNIFTPNFFTARDTTYQNAISKRIATGGVVTGRLQTIYSANNVPITDAFGQPSAARRVASDYTQVMELQVQHPLMRNRGTLVNRIPVVLARINEDLSIGQYEEIVRNLVKEVEVAYWDLYCSYWALETSRTARDSALKTWNIINDRRKFGVTDEGPASQAQAQVFRLEAQMKAIKYGANTPGGDPGLYGRERRLRMLLGWSANDGRLIRPSDRPTVALTKFDWNSVLGEALNRNIDLRQQKWVVKQKELELISAKNQILPEVNLSGIYRWLGVGDDLWSRDGGDEFPGTNTSRNTTSAWEGLMGGNYQEVGLRLEVVPNAFGARQAMANIRNKRLQMAREHEVLRIKEEMLVFTLQDALGLLESHYEQVRLKLNELEYADHLVKTTEAKMDGGQNDLGALADQLLRYQEARATTQQQYYRAVCEYNKSIVHVHMLKGSLLEYNSIALAEGEWSEKAYWDATERARERDAAVYFDYGASRPSVISRGPVTHGIGDGTVSGSEVYGDEYEVVSPGEETILENVPSQSSDRKIDSGDSDGSAPAKSNVLPTPDPSAQVPGKSNRQISSNSQIRDSQVALASAESSVRQGWTSRSNASADSNPLRDSSESASSSSTMQSLPKKVPTNSLR